MVDLPEKQYAVQLVGPDKLVLNKKKEVFCPGPHQILCQVEAVGLCFSDLKLLKQFSSHVRKSEVVSGINTSILKEVPSYVPGDAATVPGHEAVVRIEAVGEKVKDFKVGQRYLVQADYRWLRTATSNGAFGYNFEGALQEYVLMDERVITSPEGESMLLGVSEELSGSAVALVEPWACVEDAYASKERQAIKTGGQMLVVADVGVEAGVFGGFLERFGQPAEITWVSKFAPPAVETKVTKVAEVSQVADAVYNDVLYFGSDADVVERLFAKVGTRGLLNISLCGGRLGRNVTVKIGRVHYGGIRVVGTTVCDPTESMGRIPASDEIRPGDKINVVGAGGPMGAIHVIRNICEGIEGISVYAGDVDEDRLQVLTKVAAPLAKKHGVEYKQYNPTKEKIDVAFDYTALMAPIPALVGASIKEAADDGLINIFAGIPVEVTAEIDLDSYIAKQLYFIGTSGSVLEDMKTVLAKVESGRLDTNVSVAAVCGLDSAVEGIRAVENRSTTGKIIVYPACKGLGLLPLSKLSEKMPDVAEDLNNGLWTKEAEQKLLEEYQ